MSTTPNDAAQPKLNVYSHLGGDDGESEYHFSGKVPPGSYVVVKDTDFDKLREEVERLRLWRDTLSEQADTNLRDWAAVKAQLVEERTRAEAAEARATTAMNLTDQWRRRAHELRYNPAAMPFAAECIEECAKQLDAALNAQGESNG